MKRPDVEGMKARADRGDSHIDAAILARYIQHLECDQGSEVGQCSICQSQVPTRQFPFRDDAGVEFPLDDPRTWELCYVCANTFISASNREKYKTENRILGALTNMILDAVTTGRDPRKGWGSDSAKDGT